MKKSILLAIISFCFFFGFAQEPLIAEHSPRGLYLNHTVSPKETFYSVGRMYNVPAKEIAAFNGLDMAAGLVIGKVIHIPLTTANFSQQVSTGQPVYYVVGAKEGLYRVSLNSNKVLMASLRKWNNLASDKLETGQKLIVGFMTSPSQVATKKVEQPVAVEPKKEVVVENKPEGPITLEEKPVTKKEKTEEPKQETAFKTVSNPVQPSYTNDGNGGYFKKQFDLQVKDQPASKDEQVTTGIFKTASGWQDAKYYALMDNVEPGTIIRIINPNNNKAIYAKVLDKMSGIRQNLGYDLRISNAAANALQINDTEKFFVRVNY
ncbi:MAG: LysM peptidoglycan-binding domain-containing protein [Candidatus Dadabacteria bacterium]